MIPSQYLVDEFDHLPGLPLRDIGVPDIIDAA